MKLKLILILAALTALSGCNNIVTTTTPLADGTWLITNHLTGENQHCRRMIYNFNDPNKVVCTKVIVE